MSGLVFLRIEYFLLVEFRQLPGNLERLVSEMTDTTVHWHVDPLECRGNYRETANDMKLVQ